jgi:ribosomal protein S18 acetylase RimI-like enzyme
MLRPQLAVFDSGMIAPRVGSIILGESETLREEDVPSLTDAAAEEHFDLVWVQASSRLNTQLLDYRGTLVEMAGRREDVLSRARLADQRYGIRTLQSETDWLDVERLLAFAAATRFSTDAHVSQAQFRQHKLALLKSHVQNRYGEVALAYSSGQPLGYQCTSLEDDSVNLYEIAVDTAFRRGFAGLNLVRYNLDRFALTHPDAERVVARIYEDNVPSLRFFEHLGLRATGRLLHYYHLWGNHDR